MDIGESHANSSDVPLPIIIVFVFMFTMLGVICIQQLQRMFAENKEYDNIKFDIRENRATSRSGKTYGTVSMKDKNKNKNKNSQDKETQMGDSSFQNSRTVTVYSDTDEKVEEMNIATKVRKKFSLSKYKVVGEARETSSSDECIELGSGYDTNTMNNNNDNDDENKNMNNNNQQQQQQRKNNGNEKGKKARKKIREQVIVATKGLKDKIDEIEKKLHGSKLNSKKNRYKGYGSLKQINKKNGNYDDGDDIDDETDEDEDNDNVTDGQVDKNKQKEKEKENMSDDSDVKHAGYGMNYGYSEDYDCDFEDSDTQLSEEGDDKPNETVVKRIALE